VVLAVGWAVVRLGRWVCERCGVRSKDGGSRLAQYEVMNMFLRREGGVSKCGSVRSTGSRLWAGGVLIAEWLSGGGLWMRKCVHPWVARRVNVLGMVIRAANVERVV